MANLEAPGDAITREGLSPDICAGRGDFISQFDATPEMIADAVVAAIVAQNGPCRLSDED